MMISLEDSHSGTNHHHFPLSRTFYSPSSTKQLHRNTGRSMRTIRSNFYQEDSCCSFASAERSPFVSENLTESVIDMRLGELALRTAANNSESGKSSVVVSVKEFLQLSQAFSDFSACSSDISGEFQRLACLPSPENAPRLADPKYPEPPEPCEGFLQRDNFSTEIIESISTEDLLPTVKICVEGLRSSSIAVKQSAAAKLC